MKSRTQLVALVLLTLGVAADALADCTGGSSVEAVQEAYAKGQAQERAGKLKDALYWYDQAQAGICETENPVELPAAKRAAQVGKRFGASEEQQGHLQEAFAAYETGGLYADADRAMIANARAHADDPDPVQDALRHFYQRRWRSGVRALRESVTGSYAPPDLKFELELLAMADKGVERALQREAAAFSEPYLRERVQFIQARPEGVTDFGAMNVEAQRHIAFDKKWPEDLLKRSRDELNKVLDWSRVQRAPDIDEAREKNIAARAYKRAEEREATLTQRYSGAPQFLEDAVEYRLILNFPEPMREPGILRIRAQAMKLGDEASAKGRLGLAHDYYEAADDREKAQAASERQNQLAKQKMQPKIDEATKQAEALKAGLGSPAQIEAMKKQAQEASKAMQQQKPDKKDRAKKADDLESELGL